MKGAPVVIRGITRTQLCYLSLCGGHNCPVSAIWSCCCEDQRGCRLEPSCVNAHCCCAQSRCHQAAFSTVITWQLPHRMLSLFSIAAERAGTLGPEDLAFLFAVTNCWPWESFLNSLSLNFLTLQVIPHRIMVSSEIIFCVARSLWDSTKRLCYWSRSSRKQVTRRNPFYLISCGSNLGQKFLLSAQTQTMILALIIRLISALRNQIHA